ncbi:MAG: HEAT repeat domain-containing protein [Planctomycetota bacterium]|nr:HEAT repeat domain-containing protein [Planctomycetota bacterium]
MPRLNLRLLPGLLALLSACGENAPKPAPNPGPSPAEAKLQASLDELNERVAKLESGKRAEAPAAGPSAAGADLLPDLIRSHDPELSAPAIQLARKLPTPERTAAVIEVATSRERKVHEREAALAALGALGDEGRKVLVELLQDPEEGIVARVAQRLAEQRKGSDLPKLMEALAAVNSVDTVAQASVARKGLLLALGQFGDQRATPVLLEALRSPNAEIRIHAAQALRQLADPEAVPGMLAWLKQNVPNPQATDSAAYMIVQALGHSGEPAAGDLILELFNGPNPQMREVAREVLAKISSPHLVPGLAEALKNVLSANQPNDPRVATLLQALGASRNPDAIPPLLEVLEKLPDGHVPLALNAINGLCRPDDALRLAEAHARAERPVVKAGLESLLKNGNFPIRYDERLQRYVPRDGVKLDPNRPADPPAEKPVEAPKF